MFVAVGGFNGPSIITSTTGSSGWTSRSVPSVYYRGIAWNGTRFVALGGASYTTTGTTGATSTDGVTWTSITVPDILYKDVCWNGTRFVAVGTGANNTATTAGATSIDGLTWTAIKLPSGIYTNVVWDGTYFLAYVTTSVDNKVGAYSNDGLNWYPIIFAYGSSSLARIAYGNGVHVCISGNSSQSQVYVNSDFPNNFYVGVPKASGDINTNNMLTNALRVK